MEERQKLAMKMMEERRGTTAKTTQNKIGVNDSGIGIEEDFQARQEVPPKEKKLEKKEALALFTQALEMSVLEMEQRQEGDDLD